MDHPDIEHCYGAHDKGENTPLSVRIFLIAFIVAIILVNVCLVWGQESGTTFPVQPPIMIFIDNSRALSREYFISHEELNRFMSGDPYVIDLVLQRAREKKAPTYQPQKGNTGWRVK